MRYVPRAWSYGEGKSYRGSMGILSNLRYSGRQVPPFGV